MPMSSRGIFSDIYESVDEKVIEIMKKILKNTIHLDPKRKDLIIKSKFNCEALGARHKLLIGLVALKAMHMEGWIETDEISSKELANKLGIKYNTVRPILLQLVEEGLVERSGRGRYRIKLTRIDDIYNALSQALERCQG